MIRFFLLLIGLISFLGFGQNIIPQPETIEFREGTFALNSETVIKADENSFEAQFLQQYIHENNGLKLTINKNAKSENCIALNYALSPKLSVTKDSSGKRSSFKSNDEEYMLLINKSEITIAAQERAGVFYGIQTLLQLLPLEEKDEIKIPCLLINDQPKFKWRGMHLDVSRHFFDIEFVKKYIDYLAQYKMNTFHWHLTDDQGWRIEIKKYPKLTEIGAWRSGSMVGHYRDQTFDNKKYGGFYTQEEIKEVVAYAKERHITVVPEIEMPGHALAALAAYPQYSCTGGPFEVGKTWGVLDDVFCPKDETFTFLENILSEVIALFPSEYIHVGGDECPKTRWKSCSLCQKRIKDEKLKDEHELQSYFIQRIEKFVNSKGRKIIGWDEILEGGLAPNAAVMSWRGIEGGIAAAKEKHFVVMSPGSHCYFDHYQGEPANEPLAFGGYTTLEKVYSYNPIPTELTEAESAYILGAQANLWTEYIDTINQVEYMLFPRITAIAEVVWGTSNPENYKAFEDRVVHHMKGWKQKNINFSKAIYQVVSDISVQNNQIYYALKSRNASGIRFTTDGSEPKADSKAYNSSIQIDQSCTVKSAYFEAGQAKSATISQTFYITKSSGKSISLKHEPSKTYGKGGAATLVDGVKGDLLRFGKNWLGFSGKDMEATIDFGSTTSFEKVSLNTFNGESSWIYLPKEIQFLVSDDGISFSSIKIVSQEQITNRNGILVESFPKTTAKYLKVIVKNYGIIPDGKPGAGNASWLFIDEISVE
ncbi:MAG: family 20 glycosylhydrolase [Flavobacterium sp.]|jgi:hexosaminidase|uniref:glycoside hydrolase family 20 protein n=1 Tax=Flavobacterium sp. TaxID=239 RepID=UPI003BA45531